MDKTLTTEQLAALREQMRTAPRKRFLWGDEIIEDTGLCFNNLEEGLIPVFKSVSGSTARKPGQTFTMSVAAWISAMESGRIVENKPMHHPLLSELAAEIRKGNGFAAKTIQFLSNMWEASSAEDRVAFGKVMRDNFSAELKREIAGGDNGAS